MVRVLELASAWSSIDQRTSLLGGRPAHRYPPVAVISHFDCSVIVYERREPPGGVFHMSYLAGLSSSSWQESLIEKI